MGNYREISSVVTSLGSFLWHPIKVPLVCGFSLSLRMITLKKALPLCFSRSFKYNNYDKATYIVSYNLCLFFFPQDFHETPTYRNILVQKGCFSNSSPYFSGVNFSNNISMPRVWVNVRKTEHDKIFEIS